MDKNLTRSRARIAASSALHGLLAFALLSAELRATTTRSLLSLARAQSLPDDPRHARDAGAQTATPSSVPASVLADGIAGLSKRADNYKLKHLVGDGVQLVLRPWLEPLPDGRFRYRGTGFDAVILDDGKVEYRTKDGLHLGLIQARGRNGTPSNKLVGPALGIGDLAHWSEKQAGNDPHIVERRTFLERTRQLREQLYDRTKQRALGTADRKLEQTLRLIAADPKRSSEARRVALFELWADCADDEVGALARAQIERFVREQCEGRCAFSTADLTRINRAREGQPTFEPYDDARASEPRTTP